MTHHNVKSSCNKNKKEPHEFSGSPKRLKQLQFVREKMCVCLIVKVKVCLILKVNDCDYDHMITVLLIPTEMLIMKFMRTVKIIKF